MEQILSYSGWQGKDGRAGLSGRNLYPIMQAISHKNEITVCLPNKMVISVDVQEEEGQTTEAFDVIAQ